MTRDSTAQGSRAPAIAEVRGGAARGLRSSAIAAPHADAARGLRSSAIAAPHCDAARGLRSSAIAAPHAVAAQGPRTPAIEIVAVLGDTVLDVRHCVAARRRRPWLVAVSALGLVAAAVAFKLSLVRAAENAAALAHHLAAHRPAHSFRPVAQSTALAVVIAAGLAIALATAVAALLRSRRDLTRYRIGTASGVELPLDGLSLVGLPLESGSRTDRPLGGLPRSDFPLIAHVGGTFVLTLVPGLVGELGVDGTCVSLADLANSDRARRSTLVANATEVPIPCRAKIRVRVGNVIIHASSVDAPSPTSLGPRRHISAAALVGVAVTLALHGAALALLTFAGADDEIVDAAMLGDPVASEEVVIVDSFGARAGGSVEGVDGIGDRNEIDAATGLSIESVEETNVYRLPADVSHSPTLARAVAIEDARNAGLLGSPALQAGIASLATSPDIGDGSGAGKLYGMHDNPAAVDAFAAQPRFRPEGGGTGWGAICGCPGYGTIGHGSGTGAGYTLGSRSAGHGSSHSARVPDVVELGKPTQTGGIPLEVLRRYFKRKSDQLTACFEAALLSRAPQAETVMTDFIVAADGTVHGARASGDGDVAACLATVVSGMKFPAPDRGEAVRVSYPLQFRVPGAS